MHKHPNKMQHKIQLTKKYGVVQFKGTLQHNGEHQLIFESDDANETMDFLEDYCKTVDAEHGCMIMFRDTHLITPHYTIPTRPEAD